MSGSEPRGRRLRLRTVAAHEELDHARGRHAAHSEARGPWHLQAAATEWDRASAGGGGGGSRRRRDSGLAGNCSRHMHSCQSRHGANPACLASKKPVDCIACWAAFRRCALPMLPACHNLPAWCRAHTHSATHSREGLPSNCSQSPPQRPALELRLQRDQRNRSIKARGSCLACLRWADWVSFWPSLFLLDHHRSAPFPLLASLKRSAGPLQGPSARVPEWGCPTQPSSCWQPFSGQLACVEGSSRRAMCLAQSRTPARQPPQTAPPPSRRQSLGLPSPSPPAPGAPSLGWPPASARLEVRPWPRARHIAVGALASGLLAVIARAASRLFLAPAAASCRRGAPAVPRSGHRGVSSGAAGALRRRQPGMQPGIPLPHLPGLAFRPAGFWHYRFNLQCMLGQGLGWPTQCQPGAPAPRHLRLPPPPASPSPPAVQLCRCVASILWRGGCGLRPLHHPSVRRPELRRAGQGAAGARGRRVRCAALRCCCRSAPLLLRRTRARAATLGHSLLRPWHLDCPAGSCTGSDLAIATPLFQNLTGRAPGANPSIVVRTRCWRRLPLHSSPTP